ncbi:MAG: polysaccharide biosynthesis protein [Clostridia bacterium]|nr:polysaccharide biosynthesis protein [Clostridia bacterium]
MDTQVKKIKIEKDKSKYAQGALILLIGGLICKFIGAFYRIPLSNILGAEGIGIYQLIFPVYSLFLIVVSGGMPIALSKIVAECRARGEKKRARRFLLQGIIYLSIISIFFSLIFLLFAKEIAIFQGNSLAETGYFAVAIAIFFASILTAFRGYFQGYQNMIPTAISQIVEQVFKLSLGLGFAILFLNYGLAYGVFGAMLGVAIGEILSLIYLTITYFVRRRKQETILEPQITEKFSKDFKTLIKKSLPITLNSIILPLIIAVDSFLIINLLMKTGVGNSVSTQMFGVYSGMINSLINLPTIVSLSLAVSLVPTISFNKEKGKDFSGLVSSTFKIIMVISIPCILIFLFFSNQIMAILYPTTSGFIMNLGANLLKISAINILYISILQITTAILQSTNKGAISLINLFFSGIIKVFLTIFLVLSPLNIYGAAIASVLCFALASGLNLIALKNEFNFELKSRGIGYILLSSFTMLGIALGLNYLFNLLIPLIYSIFLSLFIAGIIYLFLILLFPIFENEELDSIPFRNKINLFRKKLFSKSKKV